jgi:hypothetical protein
LSKDPLAVAAVTLLALLVAIPLVIFAGVFIVIPVVVAYLGYLIFVWVSKPRRVSTSELHQQTRAVFPKFEEYFPAFLERHVEEGDHPVFPIIEAMAESVGRLYGMEEFDRPPLLVYPEGSIEEARYRDKLATYQAKSQNVEKTIQTFTNVIFAAFKGFKKHLPPIAKDERFVPSDAHPPAFSVPLLDVLSSVGRTVTDLVLPFFNDSAIQHGLFTVLRNRLKTNQEAVSANSRTLVMPEDFKGTGQEIIDAYLNDTPLASIFGVNIPFEIPPEQRFEHMHVIGGSGHGKTQLLQHLILNDLQRADPPSLIIVDSQGDMLRKLQKLSLFAHGEPLAERLIVIDPEDFSPALNMFDTANARMKTYTPVIREQIEAGVVELFNYIFGAIAAELTQKQGTTFAYVARLMLTVPGATIHTLRELMEDGAPSLHQSPFASLIERLDLTSLAFFQNQFFIKSSQPTRQQIARRLYGVLQVPAFDRMFSSPSNKLDMFEAMQSGKIVLINTTKALLKADASALFGRYMIALTLKAAFERVAVPESKRNPAFLIVDEAAEYFDENLETLLSQARKFKLGILFAHQHLDQLSPALRSSVAANTTIKLAGGVSDRDARTIASDMRTTPDFITSMKKHRSSTEFACHIRNHTDNAVRLSVPLGTLESAPQMTSEELAKIVTANRERFAARPDVPRPDATDPGTSRQDEAPKTEKASPEPPKSSDDWRS